MMSLTLDILKRSEPTLGTELLKKYLLFIVSLNPELHLYLIHRVLHHGVTWCYYSVVDSALSLCCLLVVTQHDVFAVVVMETERCCLGRQETMMWLSSRQWNVLFEVIHIVVSKNIVTRTCDKAGYSCGSLSSCFVRVTALQWKPYNRMMAILDRVNRLSQFKVNTSQQYTRWWICNSLYLT